MKRKTKLTIIAAYAIGSVGLIFGLSACGTSLNKITEPYKDAPIGKRDDGPADVFTMPDGFSNFARKCDGTTAVYVIFKGDEPRGAIAAVPDASVCGGSR